MKNILCIVAVVVVVAVGILFFWSENTNLNDHLKTYGATVAHIDAPLLQISEKRERSITAYNGENVLKVKIFEDMDREEMNAYVVQQTTLFEGIFEPQLPPYPEFLTRETGCDEKFQPTLKEHDHGTYYLVYTGERFGYGVCADDLLAYKAALGFFYCPKEQTLFKWEYFVPTGGEFDDVADLTDSFQCL